MLPAPIAAALAALRVGEPPPQDASVVCACEACWNDGLMAAHHPPNSPPFFNHPQTPADRAAARLAARLAFRPACAPPSLALKTTWIEPPITPDPLSPASALVSVAPRSPGDAPTACELWFDTTLPPHPDAGLAATLARTPGAVPGSRDATRGSLASSTAAAAGPRAQAAAAEAATGAWLAAYEAGDHARVPPPPGLARGLWCGGAAPPAPPPPAPLLLPPAAADAPHPRGGLGVRAEDLFADDEWAAGEGEEEGEGNASDAVLTAAAADARSAAASSHHILPSASCSPDAWVIRADSADCARRFAALGDSAALAFPFTLDPFQQDAIALLEAGHNVFVAAHTSAGKTVVAEYAFALAARHRSRALYTSPIKTISNQKFRDFSAKFDVGLLTGDVSIKPDAPGLILTTEVLRSMLYRGSEAVRDVEWVVFDEVHYVNDAERGVVWEEAWQGGGGGGEVAVVAAFFPFFLSHPPPHPPQVIIMLPPHVRLVLLSATVPNVDEFAGWVGRTRGAPVHVTGTSRRPVPLQHALWVGGDAHPFGREEGWLADGYAAARLALKKAAGGGTSGAAARAGAKAARPTGRGGPPPGPNARTGGRGGRGGGVSGRGGSAAALVSRSAAAGRGGAGGHPRTDAAHWRALLTWLKARDLLPTIAFFFSKRKIDALASALGGLDLNTAAEAAEVHAFCSRALARLPPADRGLPQIGRVRSLLKRGVGVHHAGLLPIVKEVVEMLFCRVRERGEGRRWWCGLGPNKTSLTQHTHTRTHAQGLVKLLLATETFAMGVNAPARAVAFASLRKHDGVGFRDLLPGEYTQMAGRAGRRGLDAVGTVLVPVFGAAGPSDLPGELGLRRLLAGGGARLQSRFRLTYSMILNLLRGEALTVHDMLRRSFAEYHTARAAPAAAAAATAAAARAAALDAGPWPPHWPPRGVVAAYADAGVVLISSSSGVADAPGVVGALTPGRCVVAARAPGGAASPALVLAVRSSATGARDVVLLWLGRDEEAAEGQDDDGESDAPLATPGLRLVGKKAADADASPTDAGALPRSGAAGGLDYTLAAAPLAAIDSVLAARLRVDASAALAPPPRGAPPPPALAAAALALARSVEEGLPPPLDPVSDLGVTSLDDAPRARASARRRPPRAPRRPPRPRPTSRPPSPASPRPETRPRTQPPRPSPRPTPRWRRCPSLARGCACCGRWGMWTLPMNTTPTPTPPPPPWPSKDGSPVRSMRATNWWRRRLCSGARFRAPRPPTRPHSCRALCVRSARTAPPPPCPRPSWKKH